MWLKDYLVPYAESKDKLGEINFNTISLENPFYLNAIGIANTNKKD